PGGAGWTGGRWLASGRRRRRHTAARSTRACRPTGPCDRARWSARRRSAAPPGPACPAPESQSRPPTPERGARRRAGTRPRPGVRGKSIQEAASPSSGLREAYAEVAIAAGVRHRLDREPLDPSQGWSVLQVAHVPLDRLLASLHANLDVARGEVDRVPGEAPLLSAPLGEVPVPDALDLPFDDDLGRSESLWHHGRTL